MQQPQFLYAYVDSDFKSVDGPPVEHIATITEVIVVGAAHYRARKEWDDRDPFASLAPQFHLFGEMECVYSAELSTKSFLPAISALSADSRLQRDQSIV